MATADLIYRTKDRALAVAIYDTVRGMGSFMTIELRSEGADLRILAVKLDDDLQSGPLQSYVASLSHVRAYASGIAAGWNKAVEYLSRSSV